MLIKLSLFAFTLLFISSQLTVVRAGCGRIDAYYCEPNQCQTDLDCEKKLASICANIFTRGTYTCLQDHNSPTSDLCPLYGNCESGEKYFKKYTCSSSKFCVERKPPSKSDWTDAADTSGPTNASKPFTFQWLTLYLISGLVACLILLCGLSLVLSMCSKRREQSLLDKLRTSNANVQVHTPPIETRPFNFGDNRTAEMGSMSTSPGDQHQLDVADDMGDLPPHYSTYDARHYMVVPRPHVAEVMHDQLATLANQEQEKGQDEVAVDIEVPSLQTRLYNQHYNQYRRYSLYDHLGRPLDASQHEWRDDQEEQRRRQHQRRPSLGLGRKNRFIVDNRSRCVATGGAKRYNKRRGSRT